MSFWQKFKMGFAQMMQGRHGADQLNNFLVWTALALWVLSVFPALGILWYVAMGLIIWSLFRLFSRNNAKRWAENQKYLDLSGKLRTGFRQALNRLKHSREFKYFRCPKCHSWLKLPRRVGEVTVTCGKCGNAFRKKA